MLCFFASELAAVLGANRYKSQSDAMDAVLSRVLRDVDVSTADTAPVEWAQTIMEEASSKMQHDASRGDMSDGTTMVKRAKVEIEAHVEEKAVEVARLEVERAVPEAHKHAVQQLLADVTTVEQVQQSLTSLPKEVVHVVEPVVNRVAHQKSQAIKQVGSEINCAFGTVREDTVRDTFASTTQVKVAKDNQFRKRVVGSTSNGTKYGVGGRLDGLDEHGRVIEIKNRTQRFLGLTTYEKPQLYAYMFILQTDKAVFIENLNGASRVLHVEWDQAYWNELTQKLDAVADLVELIQLDETVRDDYLGCATSSARLQWIRSHLVL